MPIIISRDQHQISRKNIDPDALKVLYRLHHHGYFSYLVGGSVRDLLIGRNPKDFDVVTNARPSLIKRLFRNSYLVGRRFRLVHIKFKQKIIEVSTFRRQPSESPAGSRDLLLRHENTFGTPEEDAKRRDFTVNALFYDIDSFNVIDHVGGLEDLKNRIVRSIGDPIIRFQEDPVRMIRAIRVAARIGFTIEPLTWQSICQFQNDILKCSPSRLLEEIFHLLRHGCASQSLRLFYESGLLERMIPCLHGFYKERIQENASPGLLLEQLDKSFPYHSAITPPVILAALFFPMILHESNDLQSGSQLRENVERCVKSFSRRYNLPRAHLDRLIQISIAQRWFMSHRKRSFRPTAFIQRDFFPESLALFQLLTSAEPDRWEAETSRWIEIISRASIKMAHKDTLMSIMKNSGNGISLERA